MLILSELVIFFQFRAAIAQVHHSIPAFLARLIVGQVVAGVIWSAILAKQPVDVPCAPTRVAWLALAWFCFQFRYPIRLAHIPSLARMLVPLADLLLAAD